MIGLPSLSNMVSSFQNRDIASMGSASMEAGGSVTTGQTPASPAVEPPMQDTVTISDAALTRSKQIDEIIIEESTPSTIESRMADIKRFGWGATEEPSDGEEHYIAFSSELGANGSAEISGSSAGISGNIGAAVGIGAEGEFAYDGGRVSGNSPGVWALKPKVVRRSVPVISIST